MCTAATYKTNDFYIGRTLDYEFSYGDEITITPREYDFRFRHIHGNKSHFAMIGMAQVHEGYPLYYDGINEKGLGMAGLNFVGNSYLFPVKEGKVNISQFEFIPYILGSCESVKEAKKILLDINITDTPFNEHFPCSHLHWIIADKDEAVTVESMKDGLHVWDNPVGILTNNPPFDMQMFMLNNYMSLSAGQPENKLMPNVELLKYSRGMGALGLPGDLSSTSRFIRAAFTKMNSISGSSEEESVSQFFHILGSVTQQRGCCEVEKDKYEISIYTSCCNANKGIYYYTTYDNHQINAVDMYKEKLDGHEIIKYPLLCRENINIQN